MRWVSKCCSLTGSAGTLTRMRMALATYSPLCDRDHANQYVEHYVTTCRLWSQNSFPDDTHSHTTNYKYTQKDDALPFECHILNQSFGRLFVRPPQYSYSWLPPGPSCFGCLTRRSCPFITKVKGCQCPCPSISPIVTVAYDWSNDSDDFLSRSRVEINHDAPLSSR